jgi:hypothetical protein
VRHRLVIGITVGALMAALVVVCWKRIGRRRSGILVDSLRQWPFDRDELHARMDSVIQQQHEIIGQLENDAARERAEAFLRYYQHRRAAAS